MKKLRRLFILPLLAALLLGLPAFSQDNSNPPAPPPDASCCTTTQAQANVLAAAQAMAASANGNLATIYTGAFNNWILNIRSHGSTIGVSATPPPPPVSYVVLTGNDGWAYVSKTGPALAPLPVPPDVQLVLTPPLPPPAMNIDIGPAIFVGSTDAPAYSDTWFGVGSNDTYPYGKQTPPMQGPPDGGVHVYIKVGTAVGKGWYERVQ